MEYFIKQRDGPARYGFLKIKNKNVKTPNIFFIETNRFKAPNFSDLTISNKGKKDDLIVIAPHDKTKGIDRYMEKNICDNLVKKAPCYVLVLKLDE